MHWLTIPLNGLKKATRPLRQRLALARSPEQPPLADIPTIIGLVRGRLFGQAHVSLSFSKTYAYKFRYLHRGLMQLAATGSIHYCLEYDEALGRKTAVIRYQTPDTVPVIAVIDGSAATWELGQPDIDFDCIFGDHPRILFKLEYSLEHIHTRPSGREGQQAPPIGQLYDQILDGAYWPINPRFLSKKWVLRQQQHVCEPRYDIVALYSLKPDDLGEQGPDGPINQSERMRFLLQAERLAPTLGLGLRVGVRALPHVNPDLLPSFALPYVVEKLLPYDDYLDVLHQSRLLYCPKNSWHEPSSDGAGERTYRLVEGLALGRVCLSSPVQLHFDFKPGTHYVAISGDFSNLDEVMTYYLRHPEELERIRRNVAPLYEAHLSPIAIARYYIRTLQKLVSDNSLV